MRLDPAENKFCDLRLQSRDDVTMDEVRLRCTEGERTSGNETPQNASVGLLVRFAICRSYLSAEQVGLKRHRALAVSDCFEVLDCRQAPEVESVAARAAVASLGP